MEELKESEFFHELQREIEILKRRNKELNAENVKLSDENKALKKTVKEYEESFKIHNDHVTSLRDLAVQVSTQSSWIHNVN